MRYYGKSRGAFKQQRQKLLPMALARAPQASAAPYARWRKVWLAVGSESAATTASRSPASANHGVNSGNGFPSLTTTTVRRT